MADYDIDELVAEIQHEIATRPISGALEGEYVDVCWWSRTGYGVHEANGACTCKPAVPPDIDW